MFEKYIKNTNEKLPVKFIIPSAHDNIQFLVVYFALSSFL